MEDLEQQQLPADPPEPEPVDDAIVETSIDARGQKVVPLGSLLEQRDKTRNLKEQIAQLREKADNWDRHGAQIQQAQPFLQHLQSMTPEQQAAAILAAQQGTAPSRATERQPTSDREAMELAEDYGLIDREGALDVARARRILDREDAKVQARVQREIAPLNQRTAAQAAGVNRQRAAALADKNTGAPLASEESLNQVFGMVPPELAADPNVAMVLALAAAGMDRHMGRVAQPSQQRAYSDPIFTEAPGRRGPAGPSPEQRDMMRKLNISDKDFKVTEQLGSGRSIALE